MNQQPLIHQLSELQKELRCLFEQEYQMICLESLKGLGSLQAQKQNLFQTYTGLLPQLTAQPQLLDVLGEEGKKAWIEDNGRFADEVEQNQATLETFFKAKSTQFEALRTLIQTCETEKTYSPQEGQEKATSSACFSDIQRSI